MKRTLATEKIAHEIRNTLQVLTFTLREANHFETTNKVVEYGITAVETYATNLSRMLEEIVRKEHERDRSAAEGL